MKLPLAEKGLKKYRKYINTQKNPHTEERRRRALSESKRRNCHSQKRVRKKYRQIQKKMSSDIYKKQIHTRSRRIQSQAEC